MKTRGEAVASLYEFVDETGQDHYHVEKHLTSMVPFVQQKTGFDKPCSIVLVDDAENARDPLGLTAHYNPSDHVIVVYTTGRHPKDILRSISHELVHHAQNCRGALVGAQMGNDPQYAQNDEHLREMEREAYEVGNLAFRDWEDGEKNSQESMMENWEKYIQEEMK